MRRRVPQRCGAGTGRKLARSAHGDGLIVQTTIGLAERLRRIQAVDRAEPELWTAITVRGASWISGPVEEAFRESDEAKRLDPLSLISLRQSRSLLYSRGYGPGDRAVPAVQEMDPIFHTAI